MTTFTVSLHFSRPPLYNCLVMAGTKMEARSMARQAAIAEGFTGEVKRIEVEVKL